MIAEGTIAYLITLDNGFRIMYRDSGGRVTDFEKAAMERAGRVDVALVAVSASVINTATVTRALGHVHAYKPDVYMPAHHDGPYNNLWRATEPLFQAVKDDNPNDRHGVEDLPRADLLQHGLQYQPRQVMPASIAIDRPARELAGLDTESAPPSIAAAARCIYAACKRDGSATITHGHHQARSA